MSSPAQPVNASVLVADSRSAVDGDRGDGAAPAAGRCPHDRTDVVEERLHDLAWRVARQSVQVTADVVGVAAGGLECKLPFAAGEVVIDRAAGGTAFGQDRTAGGS